MLLRIRWVCPKANSANSPEPASRTRSTRPLSAAGPRFSRLLSRRLMCKTVSAVSRPNLVGNRTLSERTLAPDHPDLEGSVALAGLGFSSLVRFRESADAHSVARLGPLLTVNSSVSGSPATGLSALSGGVHEDCRRCLFQPRSRRGSSSSAAEEQNPSRADYFSDAIRTRRHHRCAVPADSKR